MVVCNYLSCALLTLLLTVCFNSNGYAADELTAEERAAIERDNEQRELEAAINASYIDHRRESSVREGLQMQKAMAANIQEQQLKQEAADFERAIALSQQHHHDNATNSAAYVAEEDEQKDSDDEDLNAALALSMQQNTISASSAVAVAATAATAPKLSQAEIQRNERMKRFQAHPVQLSEDQLVDSAFEKEKNVIQNQIRDLEGINLKTIVQNRAEKLRQIDTKITELKEQLLNYTDRGRVAATKLRIKADLGKK